MSSPSANLNAAAVDTSITSDGAGNETVVSVSTAITSTGVGDYNSNGRLRVNGNTVFVIGNDDYISSQEPQNFLSLTQQVLVLNGIAFGADMSGSSLPSVYNDGDGGAVLKDRYNQAKVIVNNDNYGVQIVGANLYMGTTLLADQSGNLYGNASNLTGIPATTQLVDGSAVLAINNIRQLLDTNGTTVNAQWGVGAGGRYDSSFATGTTGVSTIVFVNPSSGNAAYLFFYDNEGARGSIGGRNFSGAGFSFWNETASYGLTLADDGTITLGSHVTIDSGGNFTNNVPALSFSTLNNGVQVIETGTAIGAVVVGGADGAGQPGVSH